MNSKNIIAMDVDDVCADLISVWLEEYNKDYNDNLKKEDINLWDISRFVKPECGKRIFKYISNPSIYDNVKPIEGAKEGIEQLRDMGYRIFFCTSFNSAIAGRKYFWLRDNGFKPIERDYVEMKDKSMVNAGYLLDDKPDNIRIFGGIGIIFTQPWNKSFSSKERVHNWAEFVKLMYSKKELWA